MGQSWRRSTWGAVGFAAILPAAAATAASQGAPGATSRGSLTITLSVRAPTRVTGLADLAFDGTAAADGIAREVCLSGAPHSYAVAASGTGPGGALTLSNGLASIPYRVEWLARDGTAPVGALSGDAPVTIRTVSDPAECAYASGPGRLRIALDSAASANLQAGAPYAGALLLMLAPE